MKPLTEESWPSTTDIFFLAIQLVDPGTGQFHAAMLYSLEDKLMIGDLQSHMRTRREPAKPNPSMLWICPDLSQYEKKILAHKLDAWLKFNPNKIPYSVASPGGVLFEDDIWVGNDPAQGLTCATLVVELFNELSIPFIAKETWQTRPGDDEWAEHILRTLSCINMPPENISAQMDLIGTTARIRPSDVFSAGLLITQADQDSLPFDVVAPRAEKLENDLISQNNTQ